MRFLLGAAVIAAAACNSNSKPELRAKLEDGVVVPVSYLCKTDTDCRLEIKTQPPIVTAVGACDQVVLAEDASGKAVAQKCAGEGRPWVALRLRGGNRYIADCFAPLGNGPKPDWSKLGAIEPRAMHLLDDCAQGRGEVWAEIARSIGEETTPELAAKFVVATTLHPRGRAESGEPDGWIRAFDSLPPSAQELVRKETCSALQRPASPSLLYHRAARRCPIDATNVGDIALQAYKNHLAASRPDFGGGTERTGAKVPPADLTDTELGFAMEGFIALKQKPKEAAQASCEVVSAFSREFDPIRVTVASSVIALTKTRCPALDKKQSLWPCDLVAPQKSKIAAHVEQFGAPPAGAAPVLVSPNEAVFEALTIDGKYPPGWNCP